MWNAIQGDAAEWSVAVSAVYSLLTYGLLIAALFQVRQQRVQHLDHAKAAQDQLQVMQDQLAHAQEAGAKQLEAMESARMDALRPVVVFTAARSRLVPHRDKTVRLWQVSVSASNLGPGVALRCQIGARGR